MATKRRHYSVKNVGRKGLPKVNHPHAARAGKQWFTSRTYAGASTAVYSNVIGRKKSLVKLTPAVYRTKSGSFIEGIGRFKMSPRTGQWESAGFRAKTKTYRGRHQA